MSAAMVVGQLPLPALRQHLAGSGIHLSVAPFVVHLRSRIPVVAEGVHAMYAQSACWLQAGPFTDFRIHMHSRWQGFKRVCDFEFDGTHPFTPLARGEAFAFMEWGLNWCITTQCHQWVSIHAAVLERGGRALVLPAPPGSGKSTLCAALMCAGWRLLSDEMTLLDPVSGLVTPSPRPISLKNASIDLMRQRHPRQRMGPVARDTVKGTVCHMQASADSLARAHQPARPAWVVFPRYEAGATLTLSARGRPAALMELHRNCFNRHVHGHAGFHALANLVDACELLDLRYSQLDEAITLFDRMASS